MSRQSRTHPTVRKSKSGIAAQLGRSSNLWLALAGSLKGRGAFFPAGLMPFPFRVLATCVSRAPNVCGVGKSLNTQSPMMPIRFGEPFAAAGVQDLINELHNDATRAFCTAGFRSVRGAWRFHATSFRIGQTDCSCLPKICPHPASSPQLIQSGWPFRKRGSWRRANVCSGVP